MTTPAHSSFATADPEQVHALMRDSYADNHLRISGVKDDFHFRHSHWAAGQMSADTMSNTLTIELDMTPLDRVWIVAVSRSTIEIEVDHVVRQYGVGDVFMSAPPGVEYRTSFSDYANGNVGLPLSVFAEVTGEQAFDPTSRLRLDPMPPDAARLWRQTVNFVTGTVLADPRAAANPLIVGNAQRLLAATALHGYGLEPPETADTRRDATPASVRRAIAFIEANPDLDISVADIARAGYVSVRALQLAFRRHLNTTPMRYLRRVRLDLARTDLQAAHPADGTTVTDVALRWGYVDLSRFAAAYHAAYGEHPHVTLRRLHG
ncbi:helix-turn-helix transcriptional regulator [Saccharothrix syringae]|uniref:AraC family transcriptional regulator n=1 Tax=Saccharothrix syringae TaxID=103733 RepID=A0A5Q0H4M2_SACSY|nr:helix-turn-helix transcriptional regulator [Saccharothrix syringae]QFZ20760.1 AraC family transcriptional regulator [Saccharothrix syringae]